MKQKDLFRIDAGCLSICGVMIGDNLDEQREKLVKDGFVDKEWGKTKGTILTDHITGVYSCYLKKAAIYLEGKNINRIFFETEFKSYPNDVVDSFLGIVKEMEKYGIPVTKPQWNITDEMISNQYRVHNILWDTEVNVKIIDMGTTNITLELSANQIDIKGEIAKDAIGVYKNISKLVRRNIQLEEYVHNPKRNTIFF